MTGMRTALLAVAILVLSGCAASTSPPPVPPAPALGSDRVDDLRRLAIVPVGDSQFTAAAAAAGKTFDVGRAFNELVKWYPKAALAAPLTPYVQAGIDWFVEQGRSTAAADHVRDVSPRSVVADAFAQALMRSGRFDQIRLLEREPVGEDRRRTDAVVRLMVPSWGVVRVRDGKPDLVAAYADVRAQLVVRPTGVVVWEHDEDVTHAERLPLQTFTSDGALARQELLDVLERAGQRLASEFLYARGNGR
jgi:hypothetical protein